jgi:hypothetical protein
VPAHHQLVGTRRQLRDGVGGVRALLRDRGDQAVARRQAEARRLARSGRQVLGAERVAAQARDGGRVDELGEDDRHPLPAARLDQPLQVRDDVPSLRHLQGSARLQEAALHVDHQQGGPRRLQAVQVVDAPLLPAE